MLTWVTLASFLLRRTAVWVPPVFYRIHLLADAVGRQATALHLEMGLAVYYIIGVLLYCRYCSGMREPPALLHLDLSIWSRVLGRKDIARTLVFFRLSRGLVERAFLRTRGLNATLPC